MTDHKTGTREEWLAARLELLDAEKALTRRSDELARQRQELPWVRIDKEYRFETDEGTASLADLFGGRSQLLVYHFMFGPEYTAGCPSCSAIADGFDGSVVHLAQPRRHARRGVAGPAREVAGVQAADGLELSVGVVVRQRLQLRLPGGVHQGDSGTPEPSSTTSGRPTSGCRTARRVRCSPSSRRSWERTGTRSGAKRPVSARSSLQDGVVYHTYSAYERGSTGSGACSSGSTAHRSVATKAASGGAATTSTTARDVTTRRREPRRPAGTGARRRSPCCPRRPPPPRASPG